jgi:hypothetical protein
MYKYLYFGIIARVKTPIAVIQPKDGIADTRLKIPDDFGLCLKFNEIRGILHQYYIEHTPYIDFFKITGLDFIELLPSLFL